MKPSRRWTVTAHMYIYLYDGVWSGKYGSAGGGVAIIGKGAKPLLNGKRYPRLHALHMRFYYEHESNF